MTTTQKTETEPAAFRLPSMRNLSKEERKSVTHSEFWIPEAEREIYKRALAALNAAGVPYVVAGAYAIYEHTGIYRQTKDLDLFCEPAAVVRAMEVLKAAGFRTRLEQSHWLAKALDDPYFIDIIYGMGNGLALIDEDWYRYSKPAILAATPVRVAPPEELLWHRLFIGERHRQDMADIAHLLLTMGHQMDWNRLLAKTGEHWPLLLAQLQIFRYVYPGYHAQVPTWVLKELLDRAQRDALVDPEAAREHDTTRGTLISRFSFAIDVNEWGFRDLRAEYTARMKSHPAILALEASPVWDSVASHDEQEHGDAVPEPGAGGAEDEDG
jgi:hypothetical protein